MSITEGIVKAGAGLIHGGSEIRKDVTLAALQAGTDLATTQADINKTEAQHSSIFVAGWRPFVGWTCGVSFSLAVFLHIIPGFLIVFGHPLTELQTDQLSIIQDKLKDLINPILIPLLGLGGFRTVEKILGVSRNNMKSDRTLLKEKKIELKEKKLALKQALKEKKLQDKSEKEDEE